MDGPLAKLFGLPSLNEVLCALGFSIERSMRKFLNMENDMCYSLYCCREWGFFHHNALTYYMSTLSHS